ncbi:four-domain proteases inhibitor-like [Haliotis asinina]|uniref:four-domain proteases inhibitor-like n=1 Tax=Haliotis asinina TaxID=109174 RepID=UPI0035327360
MALLHFAVWMLISVSVSEGGILDNVCASVVSQLDCLSGSFPKKSICGSDGRHYVTECHFAKAHCLNQNLRVVDCAIFAPSSKPTQVQTTTHTPTRTQAPSTTQASTVPTSPPTLSPVCKILVSATCPDLKEEVCGTDLETYDNMCTFEVAKCKSPSLAIKNNGQCQLTAPDIICKTVKNHPCPPETELVCGSDGNTYSNLCEFDKGKCTTPSLTIHNIGKC